MNICFCSLAFRNEPIEDIVLHLAQIGFDGVEVWYDHIKSHSEEQLVDLAKLAKENNISLPIVSPYLWLTQDQELLERSFAIAKDAVYRAGIIGADKIRTFTDSGPTGIGSDVATEQHWETAISALRKITAMAPEMSFIVETHCKTLADTPQTALQLVEKTGAANLKINYQTSKGSEIQGYELLKPYIVHMHLQNQDSEGNNRYLEEGGILDIEGVLQAALKDGYNGSVSVEYCWKDVPWDRAASSLAWLKQQLGQSC